MIGTTGQEGPTGSYIVGRPALYSERDGCCLPLVLYYDPNTVFKSWGLMVQSSSLIENSETFSQDLVDITAQSLGLISYELHDLIIHEYNVTKNETALSFYATELYELFEDANHILHASPHYLLGSWLNSANSLGTNITESQLYEWNARTIITLWAAPEVIIFW